jgi:O-antigen/teichoic acid export membrane protein
VEEYGRYIFVYSWAVMLVTLASMGLDLAALRFIAALSKAERWAELKGFARRVPLTVLASSTALSALIGLLVFAFRSSLPPGLLAPALTACALLPLMTLLQLFGFMIRGQKRALASLLPESVIRPLLFSSVLALALLYGTGGMSATRLIGWDVLATACALLVAVAVFWRGYPVAGRHAPSAPQLYSWLITGLPLALQTTVRVTMTKTDVVMVGMLVSTTASGVYALAAQIAALVAFPLIAANTIAAPLFAELWASGDKKELQRLATFAARSVTAGAVGIAAVAILITPWIQQLFGSAFTAAYWPVVILALSQLVNAATGSVGYLLAMSGQERAAARVTVLAGVLNLLLNAVLIPLFGLEGAAVATLTSGLVWNLLLVRHARATLGIRPTILG